MTARITLPTGGTKEVGGTLAELVQLLVSDPELVEFIARRRSFSLELHVSDSQIEWWPRYKGGYRKRQAINLTTTGGGR